MRTSLPAPALLALGLFFGASHATVAAEIEIRDAYVRTASPVAKSGAAFMVIENNGTNDDRLIAASTDGAAISELHTSRQTDTGMMQMLPVTEGFAIAAGTTRALARGGDHIMLMGLTSTLKDGDMVHFTLQFEKAGLVEVDLPLDMAR